MFEQDRRERCHHVGNRIAIARLGNGEDFRCLAGWPKATPRASIAARRDRERYRNPSPGPMPQSWSATSIGSGFPCERARRRRTTSWLVS
jgi:hypothetical protein